MPNLNLIQKILGSRNQRLLKKYRNLVTKINTHESNISALSDEALQSKTQAFKDILLQAKDDKQKKTLLNDLLVEAFAVVREASKRVLNMRHFDVQLIGGIALHEGKIAEMRTGEGKTLVATLPLYLNALTGDGVHLITVNDYLVQRDAELMGQLYGFLGLTTGVIIAGLAPETRKAAYACDITYGTNNEFGFDYLRDNMAFSLDEQSQRSRKFAVIDEVDSILIDEARTPLIISGNSEDSSEYYHLFNELAPTLIPSPTMPDENGEIDGDFYVDHKNKQAHMSDQGHAKMEEMLLSKGILAEGESLYSPQNISKMHYLSAALRAHFLYQKDVEYMVVNDQVVIVDEHTGRAMEGRRWSDGLHQAMEAKEGVPIQGENQTMASITFQNFFKLYDKFSGMTGTADTEAFEFHEIYGLEVVVVPPNLEPKRIDQKDVIYLTQKAKFEAMIVEIQRCHKKQQPILVGTASIETSEILAHLLSRVKIPFNVLNAKQHEREAKIIAEAGRPGAVTIATNMAGRGTDIILGGNWQLEADEMKVELGISELTEIQMKALKEDWEKRHALVISVGGLYTMGSERHDSRRVDNQLRGRAGRQGDPGESRFFLSMEDNLVKIFASDRVTGLLKKVGMQDDEAIESIMVTRAIAKAQSKVEAYHFDIRKNLLEYDDVSNEQRKVIYEQRQILLGTEKVSDVLKDMRIDVGEQLFLRYIPLQAMQEQWDLKGLEQALMDDFDLKLSIKAHYHENPELLSEDLQDYLLKHLIEEYQHKTENLDQVALIQFEKAVLLQAMDTHWREHLNHLDHLRQSIGLRGYAQKNPKQEYKREAFELFSDMLDRFKYEVISTLSKVRIQSQEEAQQVEEHWRNSMSNVEFHHDSVLEGDAEQDNTTQPMQQGVESSPKTFVRSGAKVRRNDPCPCGSGKKYKHCHGVNA